MQRNIFLHYIDVVEFTDNKITHKWSVYEITNKQDPTLHFAPTKVTRVYPYAATLWV